MIFLAVVHFGLSKNLPFTALVCYTNRFNVDLQSVKEIFLAIAAKLQERNLFIVSFFILRYFFCNRMFSKSLSQLNFKG